MFKELLKFGCVIVALFLGLGTSGLPSAHAQEARKYESGPHYSVTMEVLPNGNILERATINGPPVPPPGFEVERQAVPLPESNSAAGIKTLTVPAFNWLYGCSAVSGAMIAGYYDRLGWSNIYTGPTNGGVMPLNNSSWPYWSDGVDTYPSCPLVATKNGVDGRTTRGSIDDYWVVYNSTANDPYITNGWTQHTWGDAIGDYMLTSQSVPGNVDGSTTFWNWTSLPNQLTCDAMPGYGITNDGTLGRKQFYEARGYTVTDCYNQKTDNVVTGGFSFAQFKAEIDAGRPVMLNLLGHTVVGVGYNNSSNEVYLHDTWNYDNHAMTWGTSYSGFPLDSVSIVNLEETDSACTYPAGNSYVNWNDGTCGGNSPCYVSIQSAINAAPTCLSVNTIGDSCTEDLVVDSKMILQGGWNSSFGTIESNTTIRSLNITTGQLTVGNLVLQ